LPPESLFLTFLTLVLNGAAQLLLRGAALRGADPTRPATLVTNPMFVAGVAAYGISVLTWLAVLKRVPLTVATPFIALVYVLVPIAAKFVFGDLLSWRMLGGMALVLAGVTLVAQR
jgi:drug/metabolite transporter (DMT)-like permease